MRRERRGPPPDRRQEIVVGQPCRGEPERDRDRVEFGHTDRHQQGKENARPVRIAASLNERRDRQQADQRPTPADRAEFVDDEVAEHERDPGHQSKRGMADQEPHRGPADREHDEFQGDDIGHHPRDEPQQHVPERWMPLPRQGVEKFERVVR